jgi:hypothetical protein
MAIAQYKENLSHFTLDIEKQETSIILRRFVLPNGFRCSNKAVEQCTDVSAARTGYENQY